MTDWLDRLKGAAHYGVLAARTTLERETVALIVGSVAGRQVFDDNGLLIVDAGHTIDMEVIVKARQAGRLQQVIASAAVAGVQDVRERLTQLSQASPEGREATALETAEDYAAARRYVGRTAGMDVTDIRGDVVIRRGTVLSEDDIRIARDRSLLRALIHSVEANEGDGSAPSIESEPANSEATGTSEPPLPTRRKIRLVDMPDKPEEDC